MASALTAARCVTMWRTVRTGPMNPWRTVVRSLFKSKSFKTDFIESFFLSFYCIFYLIFFYFLTYSSIYTSHTRTHIFPHKLVFHHGCGGVRDTWAALDQSRVSQDISELPCYDQRVKQLCPLVQSHPIRRDWTAFSIRTDTDYPHTINNYHSVMDFTSQEVQSRHKHCQAVEGKHSVLVDTNPSQGLHMK